MKIIRRLVVTLIISLCALSTASAQQENPVGSQSPMPIVTATTSNERVRFISIGVVHQSRLQVFFVDGRQVFDSDFKLGNLIDWRLTDQQGVHLIDGSYLFLVTVRDFSNNLTQKYGTAVLEQEQVFLEQTSRAALPQAQSTALESNRLAESVSPIDRIGAAGLSRTTSTTIDSTGNNPTTGTEPSGTGEISRPTATTENATG